METDKDKKKSKSKTVLVICKCLSPIPFQVLKAKHSAPPQQYAIRNSFSTLRNMSSDHIQKAQFIQLQFEETLNPKTRLCVDDKVEYMNV